MNQKLDAPIQELDTVVLAHDIPEDHLKQGEKGAVVHCYSDGAAFEVEFVNPEGDTTALLTLTRADIDKPITHDRPNSSSHTMSDPPKVQMNFHAPVYGAAGNVEGDQVIHSSEHFPDPKQAEATRNVSELLQDIRSRHPQASDVEILGIVDSGLATMQQTNPQKWRRWVDVFSVMFAGGIEAVKIVAPVLGIPIEVCKRLYEIYDRNRKQLPDHQNHSK
ncbi:hypothetical protein C7B61_01940 [filamentous cyanobacterium CCP1]|nr:hypothetical protein C7B76_06110 [filamentous cyanobacterium CCP2]PSB68238.1 hypothetical protein C7B61_01940 [filamentous cyanobacterium CCP1]